MSWVTSLFGEHPLPGVLSPQKLRPDLALIRDYSERLQAEEPYRGAYTAHFHKDEKHLFYRDKKDLFYVAATHERGPDNRTFRSIQAVMENEHPQVVIVEGLETRRGVSPASWQELANRHAATHFAECGEPVYAAYQAMQAGVPFIGGEPSDHQVFAQMMDKGYSAKDVAAFYLLRGLPHWVEHDGVTAANFDQKAQDYIDRLPYYTENNIPADQRLSVEDFKAWYARHNDQPDRSYLQINSQHLAPVRSQYASDFERMSAETGDIREKNLDTQIAEAASTYGRVLVVYGSGHLVQSRKVFEKMFNGQAEHSQAR